MKKIAVFTSGGDAPGMNACIRAVVRAAIKNNCEVVGIMRGYEGMMDGDFTPLKRRDVSGIIQQGGTILYSARSERFRTPEGRKIAYKNLKKEGIEGVVAIGGNGTFTGAKVFMEEYPQIPFVGVPGTIDNDLYGTDYTIGYDTAINTAMQAIDKIKDTANAHNRIFFVEVMGRDAGFIALLSGIATGSEAVLIPENKTEISDLIASLESLDGEKKTSSIVIVAEGDDAGGAFKVAEDVKQLRPDLSIRVTVLGHVQRGGSPTCMERVRASRLGVEAVNALFTGMRGVMIGQIHNDISYIPFARAINFKQVINPVLLDMVKILR
ncbi:MAG: 6-phosphofructokinase [Saprospiraceae bacterium]|nr:6-phosphofructokinase [Saprospiraceae bacterium]MCB9325539.1 6-phosphofructokinase [Lewinellaceae bacterium]